MVGSQSVGWTSGLSENIWSKAVLHVNYATKPEHAVHKEAGQLAGVSGGVHVGYSVFFMSSSHRRPVGNAISTL